MGESVSAEVLANLDRGVLVLTGNDRTAQTTRLAWSRLQASRGQRSWEPAKVLSWRGWMHLLWQTCLLDGRTSVLLLSPTQEEVVWRRVVEAQTTAKALPNVTSLAKAALATWKRLCAYKGVNRLATAIPRLHGDPLEFAEWTNSFAKVCHKESWLSESLLEAELCRLLVKTDLDEWKQGILMLGFDQTTPAQDALIQQCQSLGPSVEFVMLPLPKRGTLVVASDEKEELRGCARWIRERLKEAPGSRVGLIVNDLGREMSTIDSVFRELLSPELESITADASRAPYEFSLGRPLSHEPMVQCALDLLRWTSQPLTLKDVSRLLLSPYFAGARQEESARAQFDSDLHHKLRLRPEITITSFLHELRASSVAQSHLSTFCQVLEDIEHARSHLGLKARGYGDWAEWMRGWLLRAKWGVMDSTYSSREYQVRERWEGTLDTFATLDFVGVEIDFEQALAALNRLVRDVIFAPQSRHAPVQILGPLEAAGEQFDAIWVLRSGELDWPPASPSLPLLPRFLQCELRMPGTDAEEQRQAAQRLTRRLAGSGVQVIFSFAQSILDGGRQRAAASVRDLNFPERSLSAITSPEEPRSLIELECVQDDTPLPALSAVAYRGGVRALELQAACGFRAFAEMRLGSSEPCERDAGLNSLERGNIVHAALEAFWSRVGNQRDLVTMDARERDEMVLQAVSHSLRGARRIETSKWDKAYLEAQHTRLATLLHEWLTIEVQRPEFTVVAQEKRQSVSIGPLQLALRVDRVDLVDGHHVIVDYKTGGASTSEWLGDRPDKPQVPLYAIFSGETTADAANPSPRLGAVAFAQVRAGKGSKLRGFEAEPGLLHPVGTRARPAKMEAESFESQVVRWREVLEQLAGDFVGGDTRVRPKRHPTTCERCNQRVLCRVDASMFAAHLEETTSGEDEADDG